jgi:hypothetical protein
MEKIEFTVDNQYENEKGVFTVISLHRNDMVIRWESGEEMRTPIELQRNIQKRREWEKEQVVAEAEAAKNAATSGKGAPGFAGFKPTDFKVGASKTNWRGRNKLGGTVAGKLPDTTFNFNSWAFATKSELHWQDTAQRKQDPTGAGARFFVRLNTQSLTYGFCIIRPEEADGISKEWTFFSQWLAQDGNDQVLQVLAQDNDLAVYDRIRPAKEGMRPTEKGWQNDDGKKQERVETLTAFVENVPETDGFQLEVAKKMDKLEAVARGEAIVEDITELFTRLMPLYYAAVRQ